MPSHTRLNVDSASVGAVVVLRVTTLHTERVLRRLVVTGMACHCNSVCGFEGFLRFLANLNLTDMINTDLNRLIFNLLNHFYSTCNAKYRR